MSIEQLRAKLRELRAKRDSALAELENLRSRARSNDAGTVERIGRTNNAVSNLDGEIVETEAALAREIDREHRLDQLRNVDPTGDGVEHTDDGARHRDRDGRREPHSPQMVQRDRALRAVERLDLGGAAGDRLTGLLDRDASGMDSRYIAAVSDPNYQRAFLRAVVRPETAMYEASASEQAAVQEAFAASQARSISLGGLSDSGWALPALIDPSVINTSDGSINPLRQLATVRTITTSEYRPTTSDGVVAGFSEEGSELDDSDPSLFQAVIRPERFGCFAKFSWEAGGDIAGLQGELAKLFADAKDQAEADRFAFGAGHASHEPEGLISGLGEPWNFDTIDINTLAADDFYAVQADLGARFSPRATWLTSLAVANMAYRFGVPTDEPPLFNADRTKLLGKNWSEYSAVELQSGGRGPIVSSAKGRELNDRKSAPATLVRPGAWHRKEHFRCKRRLTRPVA
jgi:predicted phage gp36 major capsid-like protein